MVPMLLDVPTLRRNKFRDPRLMGTRRVNFQMEALHEAGHNIERTAIRHSMFSEVLSLNTSARQN